MYARAASLGLMGLQEPHVTTPGEEQVCSREVRKFGYSFSGIRNPMGKGGGGALRWCGKRPIVGSGTSFIKNNRFFSIIFSKITGHSNYYFSK